jgi:hypothetical protein
MENGRVRKIWRRFRHTFLDVRVANRGTFHAVVRKNNAKRVVPVLNYVSSTP